MNENKQGKEDKELMRVRNRHEYYRTVQYLLLKSLAGYNTSLKLSFLEKFMDLSLSDVADVVHILGGIFRADFNKILKAGDGIYENSEIEYAQFLLFRCLKLLFREPSTSSFLLVSAFLDILVLTGCEKVECFRFVFIVDFCFTVLYKRFFWMIFNSVEDYQNLQQFCNEFLKHFTRDSTLSELRNIRVGAKWINIVQHCVDAIDVNFSLTGGEVKWFEHYYAKKKPYGMQIGRHAKN
ncbi:hypothetical protein TNCT_535251 [Trichonephila clavata]|uniref:Uncharacterized protein n=1 Tax=Trichonephila clavata TaxID=2740835 RepID=A0A8X6FFU9_TRICU|nr:hypothetical protein TNCT_535251 [Trichonephila clavata]